MKIMPQNFQDMILGVYTVHQHETFRIFSLGSKKVKEGGVGRGREEWRRGGKEGGSMGWSRSEGARGSDKENSQLVSARAVIKI